VFVALGIDHEMSMRHIVFCGLSGSTVFFHGTIFEKNVIELSMYVLICSTPFV
jgi:hypothetical protein